MRAMRALVGTGAADTIYRFKGGLSRGTVGGRMFPDETHVVEGGEIVVRVKEKSHQSGYSFCIERRGQRRGARMAAGEAGRWQLMEALKSQGNTFVFGPS